MAVQRFGKRIQFNTIGVIACIALLLCNGCMGPDPAELHEAARSGDVQAVHELIDDGVNVGAISEKGRTALHLAAREGHLEIVKSLIAAGAPINIPANNYSSDVDMMPLHLAAFHGHRACAAALVEAGAAMKCCKDRSALMWAAVGGHADIISDLIEAGADPKEANRWGWTALHLARNDDCCSRLVAASVDIEARDWRGCTPIMIAVGNERPSAVISLIALGADVNARSTDGRSALHIAASWDLRAEAANVEAMTAALLKAGAEVDTQNEDGETPLMLAAETGHLCAAKLLIKHGARLDIRNNAGLMAAEIAEDRISYEPGLTELFKEAMAIGKFSPEDVGSP